MAPELIVAQAEAVLADQPVAAIKLARYPAIPVVTDPVLVATGGGRLAADDLIPAVREVLLPRTTVLTPNAAERAQGYVARTLAAAFRPGRGAAIPRRLGDGNPESTR